MLSIMSEPTAAGGFEPFDEAYGWVKVIDKVRNLIVVVIHLK